MTQEQGKGRNVPCPVPLDSHSDVGDTKNKDAPPEPKVDMVPNRLFRPIRIKQVVDIDTQRDLDSRRNDNDEADDLVCDGEAFQALGGDVVDCEDEGDEGCDAG